MRFADLQEAFIQKLCKAILMQTQEAKPGRNFFRQCQRVDGLGDFITKQRRLITIKSFDLARDESCSGKEASQEERPAGKLHANSICQTTSVRA